MTNQVIPETAVEAASDLIVQGDMGDCECRRSPYDKHDVNPPCSTRRRAIRVARAAIEAAAPRILAAITTRVEQVNLPNGTVILTEQGGIFQHFNGYWFEPASSYRHHLDEITLPAIIIYRPAP